MNEITTNGEVLEADAENWNVSRRWYFTNNPEEVGTVAFKEPVALLTEQDKVWTNKGSLKDVPAGWYWVVFCISSGTLGLGQLSTMLFDARRGDAANRLTDMEHTCKSQFVPAEIQDILTTKAREGGGELRLRLHRQIEVAKDEECLHLTIGAKIQLNLPDTMSSKSFMLHYVELVSNSFQSLSPSQLCDRRDDNVLYGEGCPHHMIAVDQDTKGGGGEAATTKILSYGISDKAEFAVSLHLREPNDLLLTEATTDTTINMEPTAAEKVPPSRTNVQGIISVWDLRLPNVSIDEGEKKALPVWKTLPYLTPCAEIAIDLPERLDTPEARNNFRTSISISTRGSKVALGGIETTYDILPFAVYNCKPTGRGDRIGAPRTIAVATRRRSKELKEFWGYGIFHRIDPTKFDVSDDNDNERFIAFNGSVIEVYSIKRTGWIRLQLIALSPRPGLHQPNCDAIVQSLRGRYFAWTGDPGVVSIWDMEKGKSLSIISVDEDKNPIYAVLSPDGTKVAISVNRTVQIHQSSTGVLLGVHTKGIMSDNNSEVVLGNEYFVVKDNALSPQVRSVVRIKDMEILKSASISLRSDYRITYPLASMTTIAAYKQGPVLNISRLTGIETPRVQHPCGEAPCEPNEVDINDFTNNESYDYISGTGQVFHAKCHQEHHNGCLYMMLRITVDSDPHDPSIRLPLPAKSMAFPLGDTSSSIRGFYLSKPSMLVIFTEGYMRIWTLSSTMAHICQLDYIWSTLSYKPEHSADYCHRSLIRAWACPHGTSMRFHLRKPVWYKNHIVVDGDPKSELHDVLTVPPQQKDETVKTTEAERLEYGILGLLDEYRNGDPDCKHDIKRYLSACIRPSTLNPVSCLVPLCKAWSIRNRDLLLELVDALLPTAHITWIPDPKAAKSIDPLAVLLAVAKDKRSVILLVRVLVEYCFAHTNRSKNLTFLSPLFSSMSGITEYYSEDAREYIGRIAYVPASHPTYIWKNHVLCQKIAPLRPPLWNHIRHIWMSGPDIRKEEILNTIMQFKLKPHNGGDNENNLEKPVFMATFDALWFYRNRIRDTGKRILEGDACGKGAGGGGKEGASEKGGVNGQQQVPRRTIAMTFGEGLIQELTNWWKDFSQLVLEKFHFYFHPVIECHDYSLEFLDNPAIVALITFKWETVGFAYWFVQFVCQCIYSILVVTAVLVQVYNPEPSKAYWVFVAIIVIGLAFLVLKILQAISNVRRYVNSHYNLVDVVAFILPPIASAMQLHFIHTQDTTGNNRVLSWSIVFIFVNVVYELRVSRGVCKYVTIVYRAMCEAFVFFLIGCGCFVTLNIILLHMLKSCPYEGCTRDETRYPSNFFGGLFTTFFFMSGRYDAVSNELDANVSDDWSVQMVMFGLLLFGTVLLMNVLIALINVAFIKDDDSWRLVWIESRLRIIESAENLSYRIPGFRRNHDMFPAQIYFTAAEEDQRAYLRKYPKRNRDDPPFTKTVNTRQEDQMEGVLQQAQESQQQALESLRQEFQNQMEVNQRQMQTLIDGMVRLTSSIPASTSSSLEM